jgi:hypothetical protein
VHRPLQERDRALLCAKLDELDHWLLQCARVSLYVLLNLPVVMADQLLRDCEQICYDHNVCVHSCPATLNGVTDMRRSWCMHPLLP